jgi:DNA-binding MarR family transcriptional regulator
MGTERTAAPPRTDAESKRAARPGRVAAWLAKLVELALAESGLTLPQYRVLGLLDGGPAVSSAIARRLAVRPPSVTGVVDGLVARGLVARTNDPGDRRMVSLELTAEGRDVLDRCDAAVDERLERIAGHLSDRDRQRAVGDLTLWHRALAAHREAMATRQD